MAEHSKRRATYADLEAAPPHLVAEIIDGVLRTHPRPSMRHGLTATSLSDELAGPFQSRWIKHGDWNSDDDVRAPPFDAIAFSLADLWPLDKPLGLDEDPTPYYAGDR